jgi:lon-related putative ATP-dependent protease
MKKTATQLYRHLQVAPGRMRRRVNPKSVPGPQVLARHRTHIIGQDRAIEALELGLRLNSPGYNIFVAGPSGSGKMTTTRHILATFKQPRCPLKDYVYVHNFIEPDRPRLITLEPGQGPRLKKAMQRLLKDLQRELPRVLGAEAYHKERDQILNEFQKQEHQLITAFQEKVRRRGFAVVELQEGPNAEHDVLPLVDGEPVPLATLEQKVAEGKLSRLKFRRLARRHQRLRAEMEQVGRRTRSLVREMSLRLEEIDRRAGAQIIDVLLEDLREQFSSPGLNEYLDEVREALLDKIPQLVQSSEVRSGEEGGSEAAPDPFEFYQVNVILTNARRKECPVVFEPSPSVARLLGTIERSADESGRLHAEHLAIRAGSLLRANGGFLLMRAEDLLNEPGAWKVLKQTVATGQLEIRSAEGPFGAVGSGLKPDPIPLDVKIILHGDESLYRTLYLAEDDFKKTFKVKAEFDVCMDASRPNIEKFAAFVYRVVRQEELAQVNRAVVAALLGEAMRDIEDQSKISTRFRLVADLLREASYWARRDGRHHLTVNDVRRAVVHRRRRVNLAEEQYREDIQRNLVMVDTCGWRVGQVNGLAVFDLGDYSFGKPCRITASAAVGRHGVINIEREAGLSGAIHDKGVYILSGFLANRFGRKFPLSLDAHICFEQSYSEIDGDSASSSEVYALLSRLADVPINQGIAVTGSINQQGELQPIGGVNYKIEGFFEICRDRGLDGKQGVIIPRANLPHLMLDEEVIAACRQGRFHVWAVSNVDEGLEILTGLPAGKADPRGQFPPGTVNRRVADRLAEMASVLRDYAGGS